MEQFVIEAIKKILVQNKIPSVALIKAKLNHSVPMQTIISVLTSYKSSPNDFKSIENKKEENASENTLSHSQLDRIEMKLDKLLHLLQKQPKLGDM
ncbi:hypothetical protein [Pseudoalteromonas denitrificans]|uniref:KfrA N-terminal DNA-binding domain-containing protein n=1 Tax=Pseudoalteromonas denitrificans DSM 6059 TaxID=1123010 RepID=A0A1I1MHH3_9GAMM|nr:hypothetical protein [Pseudoalteromonas denitrificans]SFC84964.1 hypothetical protein SAMN02745724_02696 [Pseudoalteromonas denitrificans DSM 6059]